MPPRAALDAPPLVWSLGRRRWPLALLVATFVVLLPGIPVAGLIGRAGRTGAPSHWSPGAFLVALAHAVRADGLLLGETLLLAFVVGVLCAALALLVCWTARRTRRYRTAVLLLAAVAWTLPGPVLGLGLKAAMRDVVGASGSWFLSNVLESGPSALPVLWVDVVRFFPCALAILWPVVRLLPSELSDAARLDGASPGGELGRVVWPLTAAACLRAALAAGVLSLGEVSAGKLVSTPAFKTYAEQVFTQMHYGVSAALAAQCLLLLVAVAVGAALLRGNET